MTVETTVQEMFDKYPLMYSTREECFNQLFCTIGNGYQWKWGQLIYHPCGEPFYPDIEKAECEEDYKSMPKAKAKQSPENIEAKRKHDELMVRAGIMKCVGEHSWYPLSKKYSRLFQVPKNVKPDWKEAVEECKRMLEAAGIDWQHPSD